MFPRSVSTSLRCYRLLPRTPYEHCGTLNRWGRILKLYLLYPVFFWPITWNHPCTVTLVFPRRSKPFGISRRIKIYFTRSDKRKSYFGDSAARFTKKIVWYSYVYEKNRLNSDKLSYLWTSKCFPAFGLGDRRTQFSVYFSSYFDETRRKPSKIIAARGIFRLKTPCVFGRQITQLSFFTRLTVIGINRYDYVFFFYYSVFRGNNIVLCKCLRTRRTRTDDRTVINFDSTIFFFFPFRRKNFVIMCYNVDLGGVIPGPGAGVIGREITIIIIPGDDRQVGNLFALFKRLPKN